MLILVILMALVLLFAIFCKFRWEVPAVATGTAAAIMAITLVIGVSLGQLQGRGDVERYNAFVMTLDDMRNSGNPLESAAIWSEIANWNKSIASARYWNKILWVDWFIYDKYANLPIIKAEDHR